MPKVYGRGENLQEPFAGSGTDKCLRARTGDVWGTNDATSNLHKKLHQGLKENATNVKKENHFFKNFIRQ